MSRTVIVTPFGRPEQLAAACVLSEIPGDIVPIGDFSAIVQGGTDIEAGNRAAAAISKLSGKHEVLLMVRSEEQIDAAHYRNGEREADVPAGLALSNLPSELERVLLEVTDPRDIDGWIDTSSMSKLEASRATMTPQRAALARTAMLWLVAALLALVVVVFGVVQGVGGSVMGWVVAVFGAIVLVASLLRVRRVLRPGAHR
ncbi:hypothetical protein [Brevibacterium jeotgali]|uniref:Uncharacterized protein n=1 Tax=Brevibacterium jeotgali TaxID=1262550 RepID=A0A2H1L3E2_9MICO|nr:hypothetical protein [Brevibacterium jeotgali]TWC02557.1 hypothetical protein FB108_1235 [Brevibacterium jeotgali]SMY11349.1 hypothetical protein BJEO58_00934 [Brevibacterium jeotgali]